MQIQALLAATGEKIAEESNTRSNIEVARLLVLDGEVERVGEFIIVCKLYLRMEIKEAIVEEQI